MANDFAVIKCEARRMSFDYSERVFDGVRVCVCVGVYVPTISIKNSFNSELDVISLN